MGRLKDGMDRAIRAGDRLDETLDAAQVAFTAITIVAILALFLAATALVIAERES